MLSREQSQNFQFPEKVLQGPAGSRGFSGPDICARTEGTQTPQVAPRDPGGWRGWRRSSQRRQVCARGACVHAHMCWC